MPVLIEAGTIRINFDSVVTVTGTRNDAYTQLVKQQRGECIVTKQGARVYNARQDGTLTESMEAEVRAEYDEFTAN